MAITTPVSHFSTQDKHDIMDAVANETPLPDKWAFTDEKGHKRTTYAWLSGNTSLKKTVAPTTSFSPSIGQKHPLEEDNTDDISHNEKLEAIKYHIPLPASTIKVNFDAWTETTNAFLDKVRPLHPEINPTTLCASVLHAAEKLMKREYFVNRIKKLARSKDLKALQDFREERLRSLQNKVNLKQDNSLQDMIMQDLNMNSSKMELIHRTTTIWQNTAKSLWKENILMCNQETLDQATCLLLINDTSHKFATLSEAQKITELNTNAATAIKDIQQKSISTTNKERIDLVKKQGWDTVKRKVTQNLAKFSPPSINPAQYGKLISKIVDDLRDKEDDSWSLKILKDIKNKGLQSQALEHRIHSIIRRLNNTTPTSLPHPQLSPSPKLGVPEDQDMHPDELTPWTEMEEYNQNCQLWLNLASELFKKMAPYFTTEDQKDKEDLYWAAADICAHQDKDLSQLQLVSSLTDSNKKRELENMRKVLINKEYQLLANTAM
ncbi:hypothetical protein AMATHDRAFT_1745 [Amanita thiersii Skay4041]|uniref:Uncharacterized protein n=1 Tax=Amanita thiersii Skay4041 TaxID=703135 RepID=A0A2A9NYH6_9AGAR|nr:hypothetical protein AMATHDRAFT_1745 [Amanita thiersii Skay4041]